MVKNLPANAGDTRNAVLIPGLGRSSEQEMATLSSLEMPWMEEPGRLPSLGSLRVDTTEQLSEYTVKLPFL